MSKPVIYNSFDHNSFIDRYLTTFTDLSFIRQEQSRFENKSFRYDLMSFQLSDTAIEAYNDFDSISIRKRKNL